MTGTSGTQAPHGDTYEHTEAVEVFFDDLDAFGMLYHGRFAALLERAITRYFAGLGMSLGHPDVNVVVRELLVTFERPVTRIGPVDVTFWLDHLGGTSAQFGFRFHSRGATHARGRRVIVKIDPETAVPAPWTEKTRAILESELLSHR
ncbi:thioesterase [Streptomyces hygroscopicus subsp. hygroscopicus]|nr:thioesterase family protein [Streptomyces hygroscopicus]GLX49153.1 thioesterase [Streptomyces hygroscopicus subsp. hygroscopicus]